MKKIIISQPFKDEKIDDIIEKKNKAIKHLQSMGYEVVDKNFMPIEKNIAEISGIKNTFLHSLGEFFNAMSKCDGVYFTKGWALDRNCRIVRLAAIIYRLEVIEEE